MVVKVVEKIMEQVVRKKGQAETGNASNPDESPSLEKHRGMFINALPMKAESAKDLRLADASAEFLRINRQS